MQAQAWPGRWVVLSNEAMRFSTPRGVKLAEMLQQPNTHPLRCELARDKRMHKNEKSRSPVRLRHSHTGVYAFDYSQSNSFSPVIRSMIHASRS